jgi:hypothetical protein
MEFWMRDACTKHPFQRAENGCRACRNRFCPECLVYPHGGEKPPLCVPCALAAAGLKVAARRRVRNRA